MVQDGDRGAGAGRPQDEAVLGTGEGESFGDRFGRSNQAPAPLLVIPRQVLGLKLGYGLRWNR